MDKSATPVAGNNADAARKPLLPARVSVKTDRFPQIDALFASISSQLRVGDGPALVGALVALERQIQGWSVDHARARLASLDLRDPTHRLAFLAISRVHRQGLTAELVATYHRHAADEKHRLLILGSLIQKQYNKGLYQSGDAEESDEYISVFWRSRLTGTHASTIYLAGRKVKGLERPSLADVVRVDLVEPVSDPSVVEDVIQRVRNIGIETKSSLKMLRYVNVSKARDGALFVAECLDAASEKCAWWAATQLASGDYRKHRDLSIIDRAVERRVRKLDDGPASYAYFSLWSDLGPSVRAHDLLLSRIAARPSTKMAAAVASKSHANEVVLLMRLQPIDLSGAIGELRRGVTLALRDSLFDALPPYLTVIGSVTKALRAHDRAAVVEILDAVISNDRAAGRPEHARALRLRRMLEQE